jgi:hypothetical protein
MATKKAISLALLRKTVAAAVDGPEQEGLGGQRRADGHGRGAEQDLAAVLEDQRDPEGDDQLAEVALVERAGRAQPRHARDEELVQERAAREDDRRGADGADERAPVRTQEGEDLAAVTR